MINTSEFDAENNDSSYLKTEDNLSELQTHRSKNKEDFFIGNVDDVVENGNDIIKTMPENSSERNKSERKISYNETKIETIETHLERKVSIDGNKIETPETPTETKDSLGTNNLDSSHEDENYHNVAIIEVSQVEVIETHFETKSDFVKDKIGEAEIKIANNTTHNLESTETNVIYEDSHSNTISTPEINLFETSEKQIEAISTPELNKVETSEQHIETISTPEINIIKTTNTTEIKTESTDSNQGTKEKNDSFEKVEIPSDSKEMVTQITSEDQTALEVTEKESKPIPSLPFGVTNNYVKEIVKTKFILWKTNSQEENSPNNTEQTSPSNAVKDLNKILEDGGIINSIILDQNENKAEDNLDSDKITTSIIIESPTDLKMSPTKESTPESQEQTVSVIIAEKETIKVHKDDTNQYKETIKEEKVEIKTQLQEAEVVKEGKELEKTQINSLTQEEKISTNSNNADILPNEEISPILPNSYFKIASFFATLTGGFFLSYLIYRRFR